jgi:hypothetical protein
LSRSIQQAEGPCFFCPETKAHVYFVVFVVQLHMQRLNLKNSAISLTTVCCSFSRSPAKMGRMNLRPAGPAFPVSSHLLYVLSAKSKEEASGRKGFTGRTPIACALNPW